uniref:CAP domain-containing protein n=1 Tax=Candidatus Electronema sp. TaxID=2698783 RepID=UPI004055EBF4
MTPLKPVDRASAAGFLLAALCLSSCVQNTTTRPSASRTALPEQAEASAAATTSLPASAGPADPAALLKAHNQWRAKVGSPALQWSERLTSMAQEWADRLAARIVTGAICSMGRTSTSPARSFGRTGGLLRSR